jgi:hypothetical protein
LRYLGHLNPTPREKPRLGFVVGESDTDALRVEGASVAALTASGAQPGSEEGAGSD